MRELALFLDLHLELVETDVLRQVEALMRPQATAKALAVSLAALGLLIPVVIALIFIH